MITHTHTHTYIYIIIYSIILGSSKKSIGLTRYSHGMWLKKIINIVSLAVQKNCSFTVVVFGSHGWGH